MQPYRLSLVVENIQLGYETEFSIDIRLCDSEWSSTGTFRRSVLPAGATCTFYPTEESEGKTLAVEMRVVSEQGIYSGALAVVKGEGKTEFICRGSTVLFNEQVAQDVLIIAVLLASEQIRPPTFYSTPCQTEPGEEVECYTQTSPNLVNQNVQTRARVAEEKDVAKVVVSVVQRYVGRDRRRRRQRDREAGIRSSCHPPDPLPPPNKGLGMSTIPRLQKLSLLDQLINNRERLLNVMDSTLQHSEVRRKMEFIQSQRHPQQKEKPVEVKAEEPKLQNLSKEEKGDVRLNEENVEKAVAKVQQKEDSSAESSTSFGSSGTTGETSTSTSIDSGSLSGSELSASDESSHSPVTVAFPQKPRRAQSPSSSIDDPFSPRPARSRSHSKSDKKETILSPTSQYIQNLREQILGEKAAKA